MFFSSIRTYFTCPEVVAALLHIEAGQVPHCLWEPAAGDGAIFRPFLAAGHQVVSTDIGDYGWEGCRSVIDYLAAPMPEGIQEIITNPPFRLAARFAKKAVGEVSRLGLSATSSSARATNPRQRIGHHLRPCTHSPASFLIYLQHRIALGFPGAIRAPFPNPLPDRNLSSRRHLAGVTLWR
jgi:hypothetical protein